MGLANGWSYLRINQQNHAVVLSSTYAKIGTCGYFCSVLNSVKTVPILLMVFSFGAALLAPGIVHDREVQTRAERKNKNIIQRLDSVNSHRNSSKSYKEELNDIQNTLDTEFANTIALYTYTPIENKEREQWGEVATLRFKPYERSSHYFGIVRDQYNADWQTLSARNPVLIGWTELELWHRARNHEVVRWDELTEVYPELRKAHDCLEKRTKCIPLGNAEADYLFRHRNHTFHVSVQSINDIYGLPIPTRNLWLVTDLTESMKPTLQVIRFTLWTIVLSIGASQILLWVQVVRPNSLLVAQIEGNDPISIPRFAAIETKATAQAVVDYQAKNDLLNRQYQITSSPLLVCELGEKEEARIIEANPAAIKLFGHPNLVGMPLNAIVPDEFHIYHQSFKLGPYKSEYGRSIGMHSCPFHGDSPVIDKITPQSAITADGRTLTVNLSVNRLPPSADGKKRYLGSLTDITELTQAVQQAKESLSLANAVIGNIEGARVFVKSADGEYLLVNPAFEAELGFSPVGKTDFDLWPADEAEKLRAEDQEVLENGSKGPFFEVQDVGGQDSWGQVKKLKIDLDGKPCVFGTRLDVTELFNQRERAERLREQAEAQAEEIETINHLASHDVKAQIIATRKSAQFLQRALGKLSGTDKTSDFTKTQVDKLIPWVDRIITGASNSFDLLDQRNKMFDLEGNLKKEPYLITDIIKDLDSVISGAGFYAEDLTEEGTEIETDKTYFIRVVGNLINNGFAHNKSASPEVILKVSQIESRIAFCVTDNGIGMKPENVKKLGEKLGKAAQFNLESKGSGAGWYGVRKILGAMDYDYEVSSTLGKGTVVTIYVGV